MSGSVRAQLEEMFVVWNQLQAMEFNRYLQRRWLYEAQQPAFPTPERITKQIYLRRLSSWQASMGPIKHGWG